MYASAEMYVSVMIIHRILKIWFLSTEFSSPKGISSQCLGAHTYHLQIEYHLKLGFKTQAGVRNDWLLEC